MASYSSFVDQLIYKIPTFNLECSAELREFPIAYKTWGKLNPARDNAMKVRSADVED